MDAVGVIGLGLMGSALAERFLLGGLRVIGTDPRADCRHQLADAGGEPMASASVVFAAVPIIVLSLPTSDIVAEVLGEVASQLAGKRIIDTTTGDPDATTELGQRLAREGVGYLDATLIGSSQVARAGELIVTAGGEAELFRDAEPLFRMMAKEWYHVGPWGSGARMKLVVNLVYGLNRAVLAEALSFAGRSGLDVRATLEVLRRGGTYSRVMDVKGRKMTDGDFTPEAKLAQHLKDVRLILTAAERSGAKVPLSHLHEGLLAGLVERGFGELDNSAVIRAFEGERE